MDILTAIGGIVLLIIVIIIAYRIIRAMTQVVPQEERLVVYRLGRFNRIAGPGVVWMIPGLDKGRPIRVRDRPLVFTLPQVFAFKVANELTLNLWCSFDLEEAAGGDKNKLAKLVQLSESERHDQIEVKIREALIHQVAELQKRMPLPDTASTFEGVVALAPGGDRYNELLKGLTQELERTLPSIGVVLNTSQPITLTRRGIPDAIIHALQRKYGRDIDSEWLTKYAGVLRRDFPDIPRAVLAQVLSAIEGVDAGQVQRLLLENESAGEVDVEVEFEMSGDGSRSPNVIAKPKATGRRRAEVARQPAPRDVEVSPPRLSEQDLSILKRVPRDGQNDRKTA